MCSRTWKRYLLLRSQVWPSSTDDKTSICVIRQTDNTDIFQFPAIMTYIQQNKNIFVHIVITLQLQALNSFCTFFLFWETRLVNNTSTWWCPKQTLHLEFPQVQIPSICQSTKGSPSGEKPEHAQTQPLWLTRLAQQSDTSAYAEILRILI